VNATRRTTRVLAVAVLAMAVPALSACLPPDAGDSLGDTFGQADTVACDDQLRTLELAVESYRALEGRLPTSEADLVPRYLVSETPDFDIAADAEVVPSMRGRCGTELTVPPSP
jgi:hypothetical protein